MPQQSRVDVHVRIARMSEPVIDVAAAAIFNEAGAVLLACRPAGRPWAGYWEFPGGKFEADECARDCLARELNEELGITIEIAHPWITRVYRYPEKTVRLHFARVMAWRGSLQAREGQALSWQAPTDVRVAPLLPANAPILRALALPPIYAITDADRYGADEFLRRLDRALAHGLRLIQVREKTWDLAARTAFARAVLTRARAYGARVLLNTDIAAAISLGADGVHLNSAQLRTLAARPAVDYCAASCHDAEDLQRAVAFGCDFAVLSPVLATASHPGAAILGWDRFERLAADSPIPVYALGGMQPDSLMTAMQHGAHGVALRSGAW